MSKFATHPKLNDKDKTQKKYGNNNNLFPDCYFSDNFDILSGRAGNKRKMKTIAAPPKTNNTIKRHQKKNKTQEKNKRKKQYIFHTSMPLAF